MTKIIFQFHGGCMDGRLVEGGKNRSLSTAHRDPVLRYWFTTNFGTPGRKFSIQTKENVPPQDEQYEVIERIDEEDQILVQARYAASHEMK